MSAEGQQEPVVMDFDSGEVSRGPCAACGREAVRKAANRSVNVPLCADDNCVPKVLEIAKSSTDQIDAAFEAMKDWPLTAAELAELDGSAAGVLASMQRPGVSEAIDAAFTATPEELGQYAVEAARKGR